jgi:uncharacterized protein YdgA (DUF945 family)
MFKKILNIKLKVVAIVVLLLVVVQLITGYIFGFIAQKQIDAQFKYFTSSPLIKVVSRGYHRGVFSSEITTEITLNSNAMENLLKVLPKNDQESGLVNNTYSIKYITHVQHGLFAGVLHGKFLPMIAYSSTVVKYPDSLKKLLNKFFNGQDPLQITDVLYLNKSGKITTYSPSFNYEEAVSGVKVKWGGLDLAIKYNDDFTKFDNKLQVPSFALIAPTKGQIILNNISYKSNSKSSINKIKVGDTNLDIGLINIEWNDKVALNFKLGDVLHIVTGISSVEFLNSIDAIDPNSFTFNKIAYHSVSSDENNFFKASAVAKFESLVTNKKTYGPMYLDVTVDHILAPQFSILMDKIEQFAVRSSNKSNSSDADSEAMKKEFIQLLKDNFGPILVAKPEVILSKLELKTPNGLINVSGSATTNNFQLVDMEEDGQFMDKLLVDFNFSVPKSTVAYLFVLQMKYLLSAGNAEMDQQSSEALTKVVNILLDSQINTWTAKGYIKNNNGLLESHMLYKDGKLVINNIPTKSTK